MALATVGLRSPRWSAVVTIAWRRVPLFGDLQIQDRHPSQRRAGSAPFGRQPEGVAQQQPDGEHDGSSDCGGGDEELGVRRHG